MRNGIAAFYYYSQPAANLSLDIPSQVIYDFVLKKGTIKQALEEGKGTANGDLNDLDTFASFFDFSKKDIKLSSR